MGIVLLVVIGAVAAGVLYLVMKHFAVAEDTRIETVQKLLPGANCGGCGFAGCHDFACACVKASSLDGLVCSVGGEKVMSAIAENLGLQVPEVAPQIAVLRCNGTCSARPDTSTFDGAKRCVVENMVYGGDTDCPFGCLGLGDCVTVCPFGAITMDTTTGLPVVDANKCTACGTCVKTCPRHIFELRPRGLKDHRMVVRCVNQDKGVIAKKACNNACIGCGKCTKVCEFEAITVTNNVAYIDPTKCRLCRKCEKECPTGAIEAVGFPKRIESHE